MESVFKVTKWSVTRKHGTTVPMRKIERGYASSLENAINFIDNNPFDWEYCYEVTEYALNKPIVVVLSVHIISPFKQIIAKREYPDGSFAGLEESQIMFQEGDIVEILDDDQLDLAVVIKKPVVKDTSKKASYFACQDKYYVLTGPDPYYDSLEIPSYRVFEPRQMVTEDIVKKFKKYYNNYATDQPAVINVK